METSAAFLHIVLTLGILLFASKLFAELFHRIKMPIVLGELLAGIIVGRFALGALPFFDGKPLVVIDETVRHIGELSAIVILQILKNNPQVEEVLLKRVYPHRFAAENGREIRRFL